MTRPSDDAHTKGYSMYEGMSNTEGGEVADAVLTLRISTTCGPGEVIIATRRDSGSA